MNDKLISYLPFPLSGGQRATTASPVYGHHLRPALPRQVSVHRRLHQTGRRAHRKGAQPSAATEAPIHRPKTVTGKRGIDGHGVTLLETVFKEICSAE